MTYEIDDEKGLVIATWHGRHDPLTVQDYVKKLMADEALNKGLSYISDQRDLETTPTKISIETGIIFLEMLLSKFGPFKYAIVSNELGTYDLEHMRGLMTHIPEVQVEEFIEFDAAIDWIVGSN